MAAIEGASGSVHDLKEVKDTLYSISERLKYYFKNLSLEDNFEADMYLSFQQNKEKVAALWITEEGLSLDMSDLEEDVSSKLALLDNGIALKVSKGDVTNQMNLEPDALSISGSRLIVNGSNFNLDEDNNLTVSGNITATSGEIAGWSIEKNSAGVTVMNGGTGAKIKANNYICYDAISLNALTVSGAYASVDLSYCLIDSLGADFWMDDNTKWAKKFTLGFTHVNGDIRSGLLIGDQRAYTIKLICEAGLYTKKGGSYTSDRRKKTDIEAVPETDADTLLKGLRAVSFKWKDDKTPGIGFIAQEVAEIEKKLALNYELTRESDGYMTLSYTSIMALLLKKLQEQTRRIDELTA